MIHVTKPHLPPLSKIEEDLRVVWETRVLSNGGPFHQRFESALCEFLGCEHISLFNNATTALMTAQRALNVSGTVITTPYTFAATGEAIVWAGNRVEFADTDEMNNLDPAAVEKLISKDTAGLMPVHCYGNPCEIEAFSAIADHHDLPIIYDACHAFGVEDAGGSVLKHGDVSVVSFHATKMFNTFEGAAAVCRTREIKQKLDTLKNFGFESEVNVSSIGLNGKMNEFSAIVGYHQLAEMQFIKASRRSIYEQYAGAISSLDGVTIRASKRITSHNYSYFPIYLDQEKYDRDKAHALLRDQDIYARRYFYPLLPQYSLFQRSEAEIALKYPHALDASRSVLCLPIYPDLSQADTEYVIAEVREALSTARK